MIGGGVALNAIGGSKLAQPETAKNSHGTDNTLRRVGSIMLCVSAVLLALFAMHIYRGFKSSSIPRAQLNHNAIHLLYFVVLGALPFTVIRAAYSVVYAFDTSRRINPVTGVFAVKFVLIFLVQLLAVLALVTGGIATRNIRLEDSIIRSSGPSGHVGATSSELRREIPSEQHMMTDYGAAQEWEAKSLESEDRHGG